MAILTGSNIHKKYDHLHVLKGVEIAVEPGEVVAITGKSGAGKSTLLHILGTLDTPDQGQILIDGTEVTGKSRADLSQMRNKTIGFVFQFHHLLDEFTALENVCIPAYIAGTPKKVAEQRGRELLDYLGLGERAMHKPSEMSGGEQQRTAVARALINNPKIIFADEPTGNLDLENSRELHELFLRLRTDMGQSFLIVTHNQELARMSDRVLHMQDGVFLDPLTPQQN